MLWYDSFIASVNMERRGPNWVLERLNANTYTIEELGVRFVQCICCITVGLRSELSVEAVAR